MAHTGQPPYRPVRLAVSQKQIGFHAGKTCADARWWDDTMASITQGKQHHVFPTFLTLEDGASAHFPRRGVAKLKNPCSCCLKGRTNTLLQPNIPCCFWANTIVGDGSGQTQRMLNGFQSTTTCHWSDLPPQARARYHRLGKISKDCHPLGQKPRETIPR